MTCVIINEEPTERDVIKTLIDQTDDLTLVASFGNTWDASAFMCRNTVDVVFFDIQTDETRGYEFIKTIPRKTFVIFISEFSSAVIRVYKNDVAIGAKLARFQKGIDMARAYSSLAKNENGNITGDYFVM